ncbi:hypothetical protein Bwad004_11030 [Bilophila wadsworthia]
MQAAARSGAAEAAGGVRYAARTEKGKGRPALSAARFNPSPFRQARLAGLGGGRFGASQSPVRGVWEVSAATPEMSQGSLLPEAGGGAPFFFLADPRRGASFPRA